MSVNICEGKIILKWVEEDKFDTDGNRVNDPQQAGKKALDIEQELNTKCSICMNRKFGVAMRVHLKEMK